MKIKLFESFDSPSYYYIGQIDWSLLPNSGVDLNKILSFHKEIGIQAFKFQKINDNFKQIILRKIKRIFNNNDINYKVDKVNIDTAWISYYKEIDITCEGIDQITCWVDIGDVSMSIYIKKGSDDYILVSFDSIIAGLNSGGRHYTSFIDNDKDIQPWQCYVCDESCDGFIDLLIMIKSKF